MTILNDASLRGKAKALAKELGLSAQEIMQRYFFEHLLMRLERTQYREHFVIKGGLLLSLMMGVAQRTTMDLDATIRALTVNEDIAAFDIRSGEVIDGSLPARAADMVRERIDLHRTELFKMWETQEFKKLDPLD